MSGRGKLRLLESGNHATFCPGCQEYHIFDSRWTFDGNYDAPTFSPSLLVNMPGDDEIPPEVCHSFVRNGQWEFLGDCTHELKGQVAPMREEGEDWVFAEDQK